MSNEHGIKLIKSSRRFLPYGVHFKKQAGVENINFFNSTGFLAARQTSVSEK